MLGHNKWLKAAWLILEILGWALLIAIAITFIIFGEVPVSYNGEQPWDGGLGP